MHEKVHLARLIFLCGFLLFEMFLLRYNLHTI